MDEETMNVETDDDEQVTASPDAEDERGDKSVSADLIRGHINTIILRSLYDGDKYGYEIIAEIERKSSGQYSLKQPSLYSALKRLEKDGYITSYWGGSVGGGRRKYFSLTDEGKAVSEQNQAEWEYSRTIIDSLISDRDFDFNRPAPTAVDMSVLRRSTSRVPSREDEDSEEFSFEPGFDDSSLREKLEEETKKKQEEFETAYAEKQKALEEEYSERLAALDRERSDFESEKARLTEEMNARERELNDSYEANLRQLALIREQQEAFLASRKEEMLREVEAARAELDAEKDKQSEATAEETEALQRELELQKRRFDEESKEHTRMLQALTQSNEQALLDQREASEASLRAEKELREKQLRELSERHERELSDLRESVRTEKEEAVRLAREQEAQLREAQFQTERNHFTEVLAEERNRYNAALDEEAARHDAQVKDDRARYQQALDEQVASLRRQMENELAERERQFIHRNYISLVDSPASAAQTAYPQQPAAAEPPRQETESYRDVVGRLYENSVRPSARVSEESSATPVSGIDFRDIKNRASRDGLRVETVGGETPKLPEKSDEVNTVHKGKALFLSSVVVFFWCILVGGITMGLNGTLALPVFYPYLMWGLGLVLLLTTGLLFANHFGENRLRKPSLSLINAIVIYALIVIIALIIALSARISFADVSQLMTFVLLPAIYSIAVLIFGVCYFLQVRPKK